MDIMHLLSDLFSLIVFFVSGVLLLYAAIKFPREAYEKLKDETGPGMAIFQLGYLGSKIVFAIVGVFLLIVFFIELRRFFIG